MLACAKESRAVQQSLEALRKAGNANDMAGRERLIEAQNQIIELLAYLEEQEGFSLFQGVPKKCSRLKSIKHQTVPGPRKQKT